MAQEHFWEELNQEVKADRTYAQILIKITPSSKNLEEAKEIIEDFGIRIIDISSLSPNWILLKLNVSDMRNIALKIN